MELLWRKILKSQLLYIYIITVAVWSVCFINAEFGHMNNDSYGYVDYSFKLKVRTPLYPFIIDFFQMIQGDNYGIWVSVFQIVVCLISIYWLYKCIILIVSNVGGVLAGRSTAVATVICIIYALNPAVYQLTTVVLTDSLGISFTVFFVYCSVRWIKSFEIKYGIYSIIWILVCTMLKPGMIVYAVDFILLVAIAFFIHKNKRKYIKPVIAGVGLLIIVLFGYMYDVYLDAGVWSLGSQGPRHGLVKVMESGLYKNYYDQDIVQEMERIYKETEYSSGYNMSTPVMMLFDAEDEPSATLVRTRNQKVSDFNKYCIKTDIHGYIVYLEKVWKDTLYTELNFPGFRKNEIRQYLFFDIEWILIPLFSIFNVAHCYIIGGFLFVIGIARLIKRKNYLHLCLGGGILSVLISVTLGTYSEWNRTMLYVLPFVYVGVAVLLIDLANGIPEKVASESNAKEETIAPEEGD